MSIADAGATPAALDATFLQREAAVLGFDVTAAMLAAYERYAAELVAANRHVNLTRIVRPDEIAIQLLLDSLVCLWGVPEAWRAPGAATRCIDVGTGAGLPGLALAIYQPDWRVTLVDSVSKKVRFVEHAIAVLGLSRAAAIHGRAEHIGMDPAHRQAYDLAAARALAPLPTLVELLLPLVRVGGRAVAFKGAEVASELAAARVAIDVLGGALVEVLPYTLPGLDQPRRLVVLEKLRPTPDAYPRRPGLPASRPIGVR